MNDPTEMTMLAIERQDRTMVIYVDGQLAALVARIDGMDQAVLINQDATVRALDKAEAANEKRFEAANGYRAQLTEQTRTFMTRHEVEAQLDSIDEKLQARADGRDKQHEQLMERINLNALAIERASVAGNTIYLLRSEAIAQAKTVDEKIIAVGMAATANFKTAGELISDLRAAHSEMAGRFMPRSESETRTTANTERLREIEIRMQSYPSRDETAVALNAADAKFAAGIGTVTEKANALGERLSALDLRLTSRMDLSSGKGAGLNAAWIYLVAFIGLLATIISVYAAFKH